MNHTPVKLGPLALLLTVISICLTILSILSYTTAGADDRLAQRYAQTTSQRYELEVMGQEALAEFPAGFEADSSQSAEEGAVWKTIQLDDLTLVIGAVPEGDGSPRVVAWEMNREWNQDTQINNLWDGSGN
ncbi:MAG: hypothetical protein IKE40_00800 [Firmicutes bacterium]|nr:hypothetical protein [Bacillota bacterium]